MKITFKYGIVTGIGLAGWDILTNEWLYDTFAGRAPFIFQLIILLLGIFAGMLEYKKERYTGRIAFGAASLAGIQVSIIAAFIFSLISFLYYQKADYNFDEYSIQQTLRMAKEKNTGTKEMALIQQLVDDTRNAEKPSNKATGAMFVTALLGTVFSFIFAAILRNKESGFDPLNTSQPS